MGHLTSTRMAGIILSIFVGLILLISPALASKTFQPVYNPNLRVVKTDQSINIDGNLNDPGWSKAGRTTSFVERYPGDMIQPAVETEVFVTYDNDNLYVAFACHDDPQAIRATMCQRDQFYGDDAVCLLLDTFGDATRAYEFFVNPYGIQKDRLWSSVGGEDGGFDLIWKSAAQITENGYQVEMAIPFTSLRFPNTHAQNWKMDFWRNRPRSSFHQYSWAAYDRNEQCWVCQWGTVEGISNVQPGKGLEIMPTFVANESGSLPQRFDPKSKMDDGDIMGEPSLGVKYSLSSDIIVDAAINPDFSQIEADAAQVNVNSPIALYYSERRPYFQEGQDIFRTLFNSFYTRTVNDPIFTAKLTTRKDRTTIGFVSAYDETSPYVVPLDESTITLDGGESVVNVLRALRTIGDDTHVGFILSDRRFKKKGSGTVVGIDGDIRLTRNYSIDGQVLLAHTREPDDDSPLAFFEGEAPYGYDEDDVNAAFEEYYQLPKFADSAHTFSFDGESYSGIGLISRFRRSSRHWNFTVDYNQVNPSYRTETGFDPYVNYRNFSIASFYSIYPSKGVFQRITPQFYTLSRWNFDGIRKLQLANIAVSGQMNWAQTGIDVSYNRKEEMYAGMEFDQLWSAGLHGRSAPSNQISYGVGFNFGRDIAYFSGIKGDELSGSMFLDLKPIDRLMIEPHFNYAQSTDIETGDELFRQLILRTRFRFQFNRQLSLRFVVQYNHMRIPSYNYVRKVWEADPLLTYRLSSFSVFYFGSTSDIRHVDNMYDGKERWRLTNRQFFMKIQYLFQT